MKLQEIHYICADTHRNWVDLNIDLYNDKTDPPLYYVYIKDNHRPFDRVFDYILSNLEPIAYFKENLSTLKKLRDGATRRPYGLLLPLHDAQLFIDIYTSLGHKVSGIAGLFESIGYSDNPNCFNIKLPPNISLLELSKCTKDLNTVFSTCPLFTTKEGTIAFSSVDIGSVWLSFVVGGAAAASILTMVAALVDKAIIIRSHSLTAKEQAERLRSLQLSNDILEQTNKANKQLGKIIMDKVSSDLANEHGISDPEDIGRIKNSIQLVSDWMSKGMEIYAAINAPTETKAVFPPIANQFLSESTIALLTDGSDTSTQ